MSSAESNCPHCGQQMPAEQIPDPAPLTRQFAGDVTSDGDEAVDGFCKAFSVLALKIPPSVRAKVTAKLDRCGIDPEAESEDVKAVLESAVASYEKKREAARLSSAKRRAAKKEARAATTPA